MSRALACLIAVALLSPACGPDRNQAPTVDVSASATEVTVGQTVTVDGSNSADPDDDPLLFRWSLQAPERSLVALAEPRTPTVSFTPEAAGTYTVHLSVDDGEFESERATVTIEATGNDAPLVDAGPDQAVDVGAQVTLDATNSSDPNNDPLTYQWNFEQTPQGSTATLSDASAAKPTFTADTTGDFIASLVVSDGEAASDKATVIVSVGGEENQPPIAVAGEDRTVNAGVEVTLDGSASSDADSSSSKLSYFWKVVSPPQDGSFDLSDATKQIARFKTTKAGVYEIELSVSDGENVAKDSLTITAEGSFSSVCLLISEYIEGGTGEGWTKGVEIYNCSGQEVDLSNFGLCMVRGGDVSCSEAMALSGQLLNKNVTTVCHSRDINSLVVSGLCDTTTNKLAHTGDDSLFIFENVDGVEGFGDSDLVVDAFGDIENPPSSEIWDDLVLRRCDFSRLTGLYGPESVFEWRDYFEEASESTDYSDFGVAPVEGCSG